MHAFVYNIRLEMALIRHPGQIYQANGNKNNESDIGGGKKKRMNQIQSCNKLKRLEVNLEKGFFFGTGNVYISRDLTALYPVRIVFY